MDSRQSSVQGQNHAETCDAEICAADHTDMSGDGQNSLPAKASENADQPNNFELQALVIFLRVRRRGLRGPNAERIDFFLPAEQFNPFDQLSEFFGTGVTYDYSYATETLTLIMPGVTHDYIAAYLNACVMSFIGGVKDKAEFSMAKYASSLRNTRFADIHYPRKNAKATGQPSHDFSIIDLKNGMNPVLVGEVAVLQTAIELPKYPVLELLIRDFAVLQTPEALHKRAQEYIEQTEGQIRTVITVELDYSTGKEARLLVWRAKFGEDGKFEGVACGDAVEIRNKDGVKNPDSQAGLFLSLEDFGFVRGTDEEDTDIQSVAAVNVASVEDLYKELQIAEELSDARKASKMAWT